MPSPRLHALALVLLLVLVPAVSFAGGKAGAPARAEVDASVSAYVEVWDGQRWFKLGFAGYRTAGDVLSLDGAIDAIPAGTVITRVRVTDAPDAPRSKGRDLTDGPAAAAAGKLGFDLVSVESVALATGPRI